MSEVTLTILDADRAIHGRVHGSDADRVIAALAAEPETIEELDVAMRRFTGRGDRSHFAGFGGGDCDQRWDAGVVIIDLAARLIAGESCYSPIATSRSVEGTTQNACVEIRLSEDWRVSHGTDEWRALAQMRRQQRQAQPRIDARAILFGKPMLEFVVEAMGNARELDAREAVSNVHAEWLTTERSDLAGMAPRDVLLERRDFVSWDLQYRQFQWSAEKACPPGLDRGSAAYRYAGFGTHEIVMYYKLMRRLLWACRTRSERTPCLNRADEVRRLERLQRAWLTSPDPELDARTPESVIDNERRRIPESSTGAEAARDADCPCCQMMIDSDGPWFWHLDGSDMDDEFAFSFCQTREEWDEERRAWEHFDREFAAEHSGPVQDDGASQRIWKMSGGDDQILNELPPSQFLPLAMFRFAAMVAELNEDVQTLTEDAALAESQRRMFNRLLGNLTAALGESAELIDPALDRLEAEAVAIGEQFPDLSEKCDDLAKRLQEFPGQLAASVGRSDASR